MHGLPRASRRPGLPCSGAFWSFHAALRDERVVAALLLNPRALYWDAMLDRARDARRIGRVVSGSSWRQVLRGEVSPARLWTIVRAALAAPWLARAYSRAGRARARQLDGALERLRATQKRVLLVFGGNEPLHEELEREGWLARRDEWPNLELELLPGADHSFRPIVSQQYVSAVLERALDEELERAPAKRPEP